MKNYYKSPSSKIEIISFGGDGGLVSGSCHRVNFEGSDKGSGICVDYGLFQGRDERSARGERWNFTRVGDIAHGLTDILITHTHIDHTGRIPMVYKAGLTPRILATETTAIFMKPMLQNSALIQAREHLPNRLYDEFDVDKTLRYLKVVKPYVKVPIGQKNSQITAEFLPNGHVMGANSILIRTTNGDHQEQNILFTGDMGKPQQSLCGGYLDQVAKYPHDPIHILVVESTSFTREPISFEEKRTNLLNEINNVWRNGGNPLLPVLSFHRFQEILEMLHNSQGELIPDDCQIFIDAPLGMTLLDKFKKLSPEQLSNQYGDEADFYKNEDESFGRFNLKNLTVINSHEDSINLDKKLAGYPGKAIIIASGGMGEHGRSVNYLRGYFCKNPKNVVLFTCFQADGTKGAALVHHENVLNGRTKGAKVIKVDGFTSHISGPSETFAFLERFNLTKLETILITHGKNSARSAMMTEFQNRGYKANIILPNLNQKIEIIGQSANTSPYNFSSRSGRL